MKPYQPNRPRPHPRRAGWIPFGLTGQILLAAVTLPGALFAPKIGGTVADGACCAGEAVAECVLDVWEAAERWVDSTAQVELPR